MSDAITVGIVLFCLWFMVNSGGDPKRDQLRQKALRQARKQYKESTNV
jgi:hypothetical protein